MIRWSKVRFGVSRGFAFTTISYAFKKWRLSLNKLAVKAKLIILCLCRTRFPILVFFHIYSFGASYDRFIELLETVAID